MAETWIYIIAAVAIVAVIIIVFLIYTGKFTLFSTQTECKGLVLDACRKYLESNGADKTILKNLAGMCGKYYDWLTKIDVVDPTSNCQNFLAG